MQIDVDETRVVEPETCLEEVQISFIKLSGPPASSKIAVWKNTRCS